MPIGDPVIDGFVTELLRDIGELGMLYVRPKIPSNTLRRSLELRYELSRDVVRIHVPHYWALYVHEGRGPVYPVQATVLVWFRNRNNDPRLPGGRYPERASEIRHLTREQFKFWLRENRLARARGVPVPMIVVSSVQKGVEPVRFFSNEPGGGMAGFAQFVNELFNDRVRRFILRQIKDDLRVRDRVTARIVVK